ncbi:MAG: DUF3391 domain-containing protein, partial [Undibacterium sp.]|nr:DUF3391 domain-containing protein [Undibacterium sp.]
MSESPSKLIPLSQLRIGHYIYLDMGWMDHPFPVSSFEIRTDEQLAKLRALGVASIRYSPEKSHLHHLASGTAIAGHELDHHVVAHVEQELTQHKRQLATQNASLLVCEKQFGHATQSFRHLAEIVHAQPQMAKEIASTLVLGLLDGILKEGEAAIRLLSEKAGEKTALHSVNVSIVALLLGKTLDLPKETMLELGIGALLHDLGKMELTERVRWLDDSASHGERQLYQSHVALGVGLARKMQLSNEAMLSIAQHHEYFDGSGYPSQIAGEKISIPSRIISLVNHFDNL